MGEKIKVKVKGKNLPQAIWRLYGAGLALEELKAQKGATWPGFNLAKALVEKVHADLRAEMAGEALRAAARSGVDVGASRAVLTSIYKGEIVMEVEMADLADLADEGDEADRSEE